MSSDEKTVYSALNDQVHRELDAWYAYLGMSNWCETQHLSGFAKWLNAQAQEEYTHAMKLREYLIDRGRDLSLQAIDTPQTEFKSIVDVFEQALANEEANTKSIHNIFRQAIEQQSFATLTELHWFNAEQVEEEKTARTNLAHVKMVADDPAAVLDLDRTFGERPTLLPTSQ